MKFYLTALIIPFFLFSCGNDKKSKTSTETETSAEISTTYLLIRHAEKDRTDPANRNPELNPVGRERALNWVNYLEDYDIQMVFATNYNRTQQTATPTAVTRGLEVLTYDPSSLYNDEFKAQTKGKTVLIVGHSNTTPAFVNAIIGEDKYENMDDNDNALLFKVIVTGDSTEVGQESMQY